jgi:hypothetical protein
MIVILNKQHRAPGCGITENKKPQAILPEAFVLILLLMLKLFQFKHILMPYSSVCHLQ